MSASKMNDIMRVTSATSDFSAGIAPTADDIELYTRNDSAETHRKRIAAMCGGDADLIAAAPPDIERLVHFTYLKPGKKPRLVSVDCFFNPWVGPGIDLNNSAIDHDLESKLGIRYEIPLKHKVATANIRAFVALHLRRLLGHRYRPEKLPELETSITYVDIEDVVVTTPPFSRETHGAKSPVHVAAPDTDATSSATPTSAGVVP